MLNFFKKKEEKLTSFQQRKLDRLLVDLKASTENLVEAVRNKEIKVPRLAPGESLMGDNSDDFWKETSNDIITAGSEQSGIMTHQERYEFVKNRTYTPI